MLLPFDAAIAHRLFFFLQHCRSCGQVKASEDFPRNRMNKDGLHSYCKPCQNAKCAQYQRNSLAAKQEGRPVTDSPADVALPDEPFNTHKVCTYVPVLSHFLYLKGTLRIQLLQARDAKV